MSCPNTSCDIPSVKVQDVSCTSGFRRFSNSLKCFSVVDGAINLFCALKDIAAAIREYSELVQQKGYASALIHHRVTGVGYDNEIKNFQLSRSPFNYKVTGFGVSCITFPDSGGDYDDDDVIKIKLFDYTTSAQVGQTLTLNKYQLHDQHSDLGNPIGNNIANGHVYGVKVEHTSEDNGAFTAPDIDIYLHVEPQELVTLL
jgi:hypothetical protein